MKVNEQGPGEVTERRRDSPRTHLLTFRDDFTPLVLCAVTPRPGDPVTNGRFYKSVSLRHLLGREGFSYCSRLTRVGLPSTLKKFTSKNPCPRLYVSPKESQKGNLDDPFCNNQSDGGDENICKNDFDLTIMFTKNFVINDPCNRFQGEYKR